MSIRSRKVVFWGTVLSIASFSIGLLHNVLPALLGYALMAVIGLALAIIFAIFSISYITFCVAIFGLILLVFNPLGLVFIIGAMVFVLRRRLFKRPA